MSLIDDIEQSIIQRFGDTGLSCEIIEQTTQLIIEDIQRSASGSEVYIAESSRESRKKRRLSILSDWKSGLSVKALSEKYDLKKSAIYKIIGNQKSLKDDFSTEEWRL